MESEKSLIKVHEGKFNKIIVFFKKFFSRNKYNDETQSESSDITDLEALKEIIEGKSDIKSLDINTKKRLTVLCSKRLDQITEKINNKNMEIKKMEVFLSSFN